MNAIGFRVSPNEIYYSIVRQNGEQNEVLSISRLKIEFLNNLALSGKHLTL